MTDTLVPSKYRKRPVVVDVVGPLADDNLNAAAAWIASGGGTARPMRERDSGASAGLMISTLEGRMHATLGDYVIRGMQGEFYPCKPDIFVATYEPVDELPPGDGPPFDDRPHTGALDRATALLAEITADPTAYVQKVRARRRGARGAAS